MTATVDILVKVTDNASAVLESLRAEFAEVGKTQERLNATAKQNNLAAKEQTAKYKELRGSIDEVVQGLTGFSLKQLSVAGVIVMAGNAAKQAVTEYVDYTLAMDKLSMTMGTTVEDTSRLVQVADDFRVEQSTITAAMRMAVQNGFTPTIESIAQLADKYNSISDPVARAAAMQEIFGRQWAEMQPLLEAGGDAIRANAAAMDAGLVVTKEEVEQARAAALAVDEWNDSWTAIKNNLAANVLPTLTDLMQNINKNNAAINDAGLGWMRLIPGLQGVASLIGYQNSLQGDSTDAVEENTAATRKETQEVTRLGTGVQRASWQMDAYRASVDQSAQATDEIRGKMLRYEATVKAVETAAKDLEKAHDGIIDSQRKLADAQASFNENYGSKAAAALSKYAGEGKKYREGLEIQDQVLGTTTAKQYDAQKALEELSQKFASGKITNAEYKEGLEAQKPAWEALDTNIQKAKTALQEAYAEWNKFYGALSTANGSEFHVRVNVDYSGMGGGQSTANTGAGGAAGQTGRHGGEAYASGGQFVIPPGYNETWPVGPNKTASSGETVTITPPGRNPPGAGGLVINNLYLNGVQTTSQLYAALGRAAQNARNSGAAAAGVR